MVSGSMTSGSHEANDGFCSDKIPFMDINTGEMGIERLVAVGVGDDDMIAVVSF